MDGRGVSCVCVCVFILFSTLYAVFSSFPGKLRTCDRTDLLCDMGWGGGGVGIMTNVAHAMQLHFVRNELLPNYSPITWLQSTKENGHSMLNERVREYVYMYAYCQEHLRDSPHEFLNILLTLLK